MRDDNHGIVMHHAGQRSLDLRRGWGYFEIRFTTHDAGGVTAVDIACAQRFDAVLE